MNDHHVWVGAPKRHKVVLCYLAVAIVSIALCVEFALALVDPS